MCALTARERPARDWHPTGPGPRRHRRGHAGRGARGLCRLARVCAPRGLDAAACPPARRMAPGVGTRVAAPAPRPAASLAGAGADRSGPLGPLAVAADGPPGLASVSTAHPGSPVPARRSGPRVRAPGVGRAARAPLAWRRHRVARAGLPPGVPAGRLVGRRPCGTLVHPHRCGPRRVRRPLVWAADLMRTALQRHQTGRRAVAIDAHDPPGTGRPALARPGGGHAGEDQRGPCPRRRPAPRGGRPAGPQAPAGPAHGGHAPSPTPVAAGGAVGAGLPKHRPALPPSLAAGAGALAGHPPMCGAVPRAVTSGGTGLWIKTYPQKPGGVGCKRLATRPGHSSRTSGPPATRATHRHPSP